MNNLDHLLRALRETVPEADEFQRQALLGARRMLSAETGPPPFRRGLTSVRRPRRLFLAAALAVAIAASVTLVPTSGGGGQNAGGRLVPIGVTPASADAVLVGAARTSSRQAWHPLSDHEWLYYHFAMGYPGKSGRVSSKASFREDAWLASDGGARVVQYSDRDVLLVGPARAQLTAERAFQRRTSHFVVATVSPPWPPSFTYREITGLPTRVRALRDWLDRQAARLGERGSKGMLVVLQELVLDPRLSPKTAAALYRIVSQIADATLVGTIRDPLGRVGTAIGFRISIDTQTQLIFDRRTGRVLAVREVSLGKDAPDPPRGTVEGWQGLSRMAVVHSDHQIPRAPG